MASPALRIHAVEASTRANGPGRRFGVWLQGCPLACPGCYNPDTHAPDVGRVVPVDDLLRAFEDAPAPLEGITISGGEPLQQAPALLALLRRVRAETPLSVILFTGYPWEVAARHAEIISLVDVVLAGPYRREHHLAHGLRGSSNKTVHLVTSRYTRADLDAVPLAEIVIQADGDVTLTGIDPLAGL